MLQTIREKTQGWIATVILGFICFTFALWGIHYYLDGASTNTTLAKVDGTKISEQTFNTVFRHLQQQKAYDLGANYSTDDEFQNKLKEQTLDLLINNQIISKALQKQGFYVSNDQIQQFVSALPAFQEGGRFSEEKFQQALMAMNTNPDDFFAELATKAMISQLQFGIASSSFALQNEVKQALTFINQTRDLGFMIIRPSQHLENLNITDSQIQQYYDAHKADFTLPEKVSVAYLLLTAENLLKRQVVTDEQAQQFFNNNSEQYKKENKHFPDVKAQIKNELAKQQAESQFATLSQEFANLAYESPNSLEAASKALNIAAQTTDFFDQKGHGATGVFANPQVLKAAFSDDVLHQGYNSDVISIDPQTQLVIRLNEHHAAVLQPLDKVKSQIVEILKKQTQYDNAKKIAENAALDLTTGDQGSAVAERYNLSFQEKTGLKRNDKTVDGTIITQLFALQRPADKNHPTTAVVDLAGGDIAVVALYDILPAKANETETGEEARLQETLSKEWSTVFYQLYLESIQKNAKVKKYINFDKIQTEESA